MDSLLKMVGRWEEKRKTYSEISIVGEMMVGLSERHEQDLIEALRQLADTPVPYGEVEDLTGYSKGSLINRKDIPNIGTKGEPAFRLGDLPFKAGHATGGRLLLALASLLEQRGKGLRLAA